MKPSRLTFLFVMYSDIINANRWIIILCLCISSLSLVLRNCKSHCHSCRAVVCAVQQNKYKNILRHFRGMEHKNAKLNYLHEFIRTTYRRECGFTCRVELIITNTFESLFCSEFTSANESSLSSNPALIAY